MNFARLLPVLLLALVPFGAHAECGGKAFAQLQKLSGKWEVYRDNRLVGRLQFEPGAQRCVLLERWQALDGTEAVAMHWDELRENDDGDAKAKHFLHQVYVDNTGWVMKAQGSLENDAIVYQGPATIRGEDVVLRATIHGLGSEEIVHISDVSKDDGATWQRVATMTYRRAE